MAWKISYNYCRVCGHVPGKNDEPNRAPIKFWDPDDGWIIGTLCRWCHEEVGNVQPKPEDFAYARYYGDDPDFDIAVDTDEDPLLAFM